MEHTETTIKDVEIKNAFYFPTPNANYKEIKHPLFNDEIVKSWTFNGLLIMATVGNYDGVQWLHVSVSRKSKLPTYTELQMIKRDFIGDDRKAIFVFPKKSNYVNIHNFCLHLWSCEKDIIPDFDGGLGTI